MLWESRCRRPLLSVTMAALRSIMGLPSRSRGPNSVMSRLESVSHHSTPVMSLSQTAHIEAFVSRLVDAHNFFERIDRGYVSTNSYHNATYDRA